MIKSASEIKKMQIAGNLASKVLIMIEEYVKPGVTTDEVDNLCYEYINDKGAYSAPLFYRGFPKSCCTSANHVICHGIPQNKILNERSYCSNRIALFYRRFIYCHFPVKSQNYA